jgi:uncharacterized protein (DUF1810 family)
VEYYLKIGKVIDYTKAIKNRLIEFIKCQLGKSTSYQHSVFSKALEEITACRKKTDWIWYIIPSKTDNDSRTNTNKYFCINNDKYSPVMVSHYLMIPYLKKNYETIITEIYKCLKTQNIKTILSNDDSKFIGSIKEFLTGYTNIYTQKKAPSDYQFITILYELNNTLNPIEKSKSTKKIQYHSNIKHSNKNMRGKVRRSSSTST